MLGLKSPPTRAPSTSANGAQKGSSLQRHDSRNDRDHLIRTLLSRHESLLSRLKNYNMVLITAKQLHRDTAQVMKTEPGAGYMVDIVSSIK